MRETTVIPSLGGLAADFRLAVRMLWKSRGFTAIATATLALGIGANAALFSLVDALLLRSLPVREPSRLVTLARLDVSTGKLLPIDRPTLEGIAGIDRMFSGVIAERPLARPAVSVDGEPEPSRLVVQTTSGYFRLLGVEPSPGQAEGHGAAAVISAPYWRARFAGSPDVLHRRLTIDGEQYPIAGVAPAGFTGLSLDASVDIWIHAPAVDFASPSIVARLQPGVGIDQARQAADAWFRHRDAQEGREPAEPPRTTMAPAGQGTSTLREQYRTALVALMALVVVVLLITCTNLGNLLVVRNTNRMRELTVRAALGARRSRLVSQLLVESLVLAVIGGGAGWLVARSAGPLLLAALPVAEVPSSLVFRTDLRMTAFLGAVCLLSVLVFGVAPAWRATRVDVAAALKTGQRTATAAASRRLGLWLVAGQVALSIVLLASAGLFLQTVRNVARLDLGFDHRNLVQVELNERGYRLQPGMATTLNRQVLERVAALPGVMEVTGIGFPMFPSYFVGVPSPDGPAGGTVGPAFFETMEIPLVRGRLFTPADETRTDPVLVVSEEHARSLFPGEDPIGKSFEIGGRRYDIVGIVGDAKLSNVRWTDRLSYRLALRETRVLAVLVVRTAVDPETLFRPIRQAVEQVHPRLFLSVRTVDDVLNRSIARERMVAAGSAVFGAIGILLAGIGLFGVAAFSVAQRTSELGIRIALGAEGWDVVRDSLGTTVRVFLVGFAAGAIAAVLAARLLGSQIAGLLFGLEPTDWVATAAAGAVMLVVAIAACAIPAVRATRVDPLTAIRAE